LRYCGRALRRRPETGILLTALSGVARAVELLAHRAQGEPDLRLIQQLWQKKHTRLLQRGQGQSKDHSLHATYEVALTHADLTGTSREVLRLLAAPPTGIERADLAVLGEAAPEQASVLRDLSLIYLEGERYRLLAPFRHYVLDEMALSPEALRLLLAHYVEFATLHGAKVGADGGARAVRQLLRELPNLQWAIREWVSDDESLPSGVRAAGALAEFTRFTGLGDGQLLSWLATLTRDRGLLRQSADCEQSLGDILRARSDHAGAKAKYEKALPLYVEVGDKLGEANCERSLGNILLDRSEHAEAQAKYEKALPLYVGVGDKLGEANCEFRLGAILLARSEPEGAQAKYEKALLLYVEVGDKLGEANCQQGLADILRARSDHVEAQAKYKKALRLYGELGWKLGEGTCQQGLGDIQRANCQDSGAKAQWELALRLFTDFGDPYSMGDAHWRLARVSDHPAERERHLREARDCFTRINRPDLVEMLRREFPD